MVGWVAELQIDVLVKMDFLSTYAQFLSLPGKWLSPA